MRKELNENFDLQIRQMMEGAQEPAPAGAWEAISSRLDAMAGVAVTAPSQSAAADSGRRIWYWAGAALAMAASVAIGIFLFGTHNDNSNLINIDNSSTLVAEAAVTENVATATEVPAMVSVEVPVAVAKKATAAKPEANPAPAVSRAQNDAVSGTDSENAADGAQNAAVSGTNTSNPAASAEGRKETASREAEPAAGIAQNQTGSFTGARTDPFAEMAFEESRGTKSSKNISAVLIGGMSNNNATAGISMQAAPGAYAQSSITEKSQSNYGIPATFGLGLRFAVNDIVSLGTGIDYSLLVRTFEGTYTAGTPVTGDIRHTVQYIGIPVDFFATLLKTNDLSFYANVGIEAEYALTNKYSILTTGDVVNGTVKGLQWSVGSGLGMEFMLGSKTGLFVEPSIRYYFDCEQPKSVRTDKPFQLILRAGLRFNL